MSEKMLLNLTYINSNRIVVDCFYFTQAITLSLLVLLQ